MTALRNTLCGGYRANLLAGALVSALAIGGCAMKPMVPVAKAMGASLSGASEVPPVIGAGTGSADASLNSDTNVLSWTISYTGLSGPVTAGHFHGPALAGVNAGVVLPLSGSLASPITGSALLSPAQLADLMAGRWYLNLHTAANPGGDPPRRPRELEREPLRADRDADAGNARHL